MNLKSILKQIKSYESSISTVLGFVIIVIIGLLVVNYFRNTDTADNTIDTTSSIATTTETTHTVEYGESLWTIAEEYYNDGFRWQEIMEANNISDPSDIEVGQEIIIPDTTDTLADASTAPTIEAIATSTPVVTMTAEPTVAPTIEPTESPVATPVSDPSTQETETPDSYTVVRGDNLWNIAVKVYGDGYRWTDIAEANDLVHPGIIHAGNVLVLPQ